MNQLNEFLLTNRFRMFSVELSLSFVGLFIIIFAFKKIFYYFVRESSTKFPPNMIQSSESPNISQVDRRSHIKLRKLPLVGNLFDLRSNPHRNLFELSSVYGDVLQLQLGKWKAVVLNGESACREAFLQNGKHTSSRPNFESYQHYSNGKSLSFQPFNGIWQIQRKASSRTIAKLVNSGLVSKLSLRQADKLINCWSTKVHKKDGFDPSEDVAKIVGEFVYSFAYGEDEHLEDNKEFVEILLRPNPGTDLLAAGNNIDFLPWFLRFISNEKQNRHIHRMNEFVRLHDLMKIKVKEKIQTKSDFSNLGESDRDNDDDNSFGRCIGSVMEGMIQEVQKLFKEEEDEIEIENSSDFCRITLHKDCLLNLPSEFLSAGSETSTAALLWLIRFVAENEAIQEKIFSELFEYIRLKKTSNPNVETITIDQTDRIHLPFTEASFLESLRLMAVVPFGLPHFTTADVQLGEKNIPENTLVLPNLWSAGRDPRNWEEPEIFRPERHLPRCPLKTDCSIPVNSKHFKQENFFPFGLGRRRCVGEPVGKILNFVIFANLILKYKIDLLGDLDLSTGDSSASNDSKLHKVYKCVLDYILNTIHPSLGSNQYVDKNILESYGDVMKPRAYKILLTCR